MKKWLVAVMALFVLAACGDNESNNNASPKELEKTIDDGTVGFEVLGDSIQEATNVPEEEKMRFYLLLMNIFQPLMKKI